MDVKAFESVKCMVSPKAAKIMGVTSNTLLTTHDSMDGLKEKPKGLMNQLDHLDRTEIAMDKMKLKIDAEDEAVKSYYIAHSSPTRTSAETSDSSPENNGP